MIEDPSSTDSQLIAQQFQQDIEIASSRNNLANTPLEWRAEVVDRPLVVKDVDGRVHIPPEDPVELLNVLSLGDISPPRIHAAYSGNTGKRKRQELEALRDSPQKRIERADYNLNASRRETTPRKSRTAPAGKLGRVMKLGRPDPISNGTKGDFYTVPGFPDASESAEPEAPSSMISANQSMGKAANRQKGQNRNPKRQHQQEGTVSDPSHLVLDQAQVTRTSNIGSRHTQASSIGMNIDKMVEVDNVNSVSPRRAISEDKPQPVANVRKQAQTNGGPKPESASSTRILRSHATKDKSQRTESPESFDRRSRTLSHSSNSGKGDDNSAVENVGDAYNDASGSESDAHPDGRSDVDQNYDDHDDNDGNDQPCSDEIEQDHQENGVVVPSRLDPGEDVVDPEIELFGQDNSWATVLNGAREVGMSKVKGAPVKRKPKLETRRIRNMITLVKKVKGIYRDLQQYQETDHDGGDDLHEQLIEGLDNIGREIKRVSEKKAGNQKAEIIQDIYAHAIPHLVKLLEVALQCRTKDYSKSHDTDALQEIIALQDDILELCHKARKWEAKPLTTRPIIRPTSHKILPYLRDVRTAFQTELEEREEGRNREVELQKQKKATSKRRKEYDEEKRRREEESQRRREEIWREIVEQLDQNEGTSADRGRSNQLSEDSSILGTPRFRQSFTFNHWTQEQDLELLRRLQWKALRRLPGLYLNNHT